MTGRHSRKQNPRSQVQLVSLLPDTGEGGGTMLLNSASAKRSNVVVVQVVGPKCGLGVDVTFMGHRSAEIVLNSALDPLPAASNDSSIKRAMSARKLFQSASRQARKAARKLENSEDASAGSGKDIAALALETAIRESDPNAVNGSMHVLINVRESVLTNSNAVLSLRGVETTSTGGGSFLNAASVRAASAQLHIRSALNLTPERATAAFDSCPSHSWRQRWNLVNLQQAICLGASPNFQAASA